MNILATPNLDDDLLPEHDLTNLGPAPHARGRRLAGQDRLHVKVVEIKESQEPGLRHFDNGITHHHEAVTELAHLLETVARSYDDEENPQMAPDGFELYQQWWSLADRLYTLLGSKEEAVKYIRTTSIVFPGLLNIKDQSDYIL